MKDPCPGSGGPPGEIVDDGTRQSWHAGGAIGRNPRALCPECGREVVLYLNRGYWARQRGAQPALAEHQRVVRAAPMERLRICEDALRRIASADPAEWDVESLALIAGGALESLPVEPR